MKKCISLILSLLLVISVAMPVWASENDSNELPGMDISGGIVEGDPGFDADEDESGSGADGEFGGAGSEDSDEGGSDNKGSDNETETNPGTGSGGGEGTGGEGNTGSEGDRDEGTEPDVPSGGDATEHQHSWDGGTITIAPTCTDKGVKTYRCSCGATFDEVVEAKGHAYSEWGGDEDSHSRSCSACGVQESGGHSWADVVVTLAPTCKDEGATAQVCTICGGAVVEILPKLTTHTYDNACDPECNVCGVTRTAEHKFSAAWSKNSTKHWHACTICGATTDTAAHYPGPAATEEKDQICLTCNYVMTPKLNHVHKYSAKWSSDDTAHWYACDGCEEQKDYAFHEYDDLCDPDCNVCGFTSPTAHEYDKEWSADETGHWTVCLVCGEEKALEPHTADPDTPETEAQLCSVCGYEMAPAKQEAHIHQGGDAWQTDGETHWKTCECGEVLEEGTHTWDEGTVAEDSTVIYVCQECGATRSEGTPRQPGGFPFALVLGILVVIALGLLVALIILLRSGKKNTGKFAK